MKWAELTLTTEREAMEAVSNLFHESGAGGVVIKDPKIVPQLDEDELWQDPQKLEKHAEHSLIDRVYVMAYLPWDEELSNKLSTIRERISDMENYGLNVSANDLNVSKVDEDDWSEAWKEYYQPVNVNGITVRPTWTSPDNNEQTTIWLDPGMAFGTGTHPTTIMCISFLKQYLQGNEKVIDLGCGSGILSIAAAKLGVEKVFAYDIDSVACRVAGQNANLNEVRDLIDIKRGDVKKQVVEEKADVVVGNLISDIIISLVPNIKYMMKENAIFIGSGIAVNKKEAVIDEFNSHGMEIVAEETSGEWIALVVRN
ncbi:50S ribosomal protein L11 methyltransferase [Natranaerobius thermophilus]